VIYKLVLSYRGARYAGWQRQQNAPTVQGTVESAIEKLLGERVSVIGCSRTDAGVHARGQVAHLALSRCFPTRALVHGSNHYLPEDIRVLAAAAMPDDFHSRKSALGKQYRYQMSRAEVISPLDSPFVVPLDRRVDVDAVRAAALLLSGRHDFSAFAKTGGSHHSAVRCLKSVQVDECGDRVDLVFSGDGFLRGMVRALVGTLLEVGRGQRSRNQLAALLSGGERAQAGPAAPARGLVLERVFYPPRFESPPL
jgi:tRNA pseudouridine38-40 synthase